MTISHARRIGRHRKASAYIVAVFALLVLAAVTGAMLHESDRESAKSTNQGDVMNARLCAESGMDVMRSHLLSVSLPADTTNETLMGRLQDALEAQGLAFQMNASTDGEQVAGASMSLAEPISLPQGGFSCTFRLETLTQCSQCRSIVQGESCRICGEDGQLTQSEVCRMVVTGQADEVTRSVALSFDLVGRNHPAFDYGIATRGKVEIGGSASLTETNDPLHGMKILSTLVSDSDRSIAIGGSADVNGSLHLTSDNKLQAFGFGINGSKSDEPPSGNFGGSVSGSNDKAEIYNQYVHASSPIKDIPEIDQALLAEMISVTEGRLYSDSTNSMTNVYVPSGTKVNFKSDMVINGVLYLEPGAEVHFHGKCTINGIIVSSEPGQQVSMLYYYDADSFAPTVYKKGGNGGGSGGGSGGSGGSGGNSSKSSTITFHGQTQIRDVSNVDESVVGADQYEKIKGFTGTSMLLPGYSVEFRGNSNAMANVMAADAFFFGGNSGSNKSDNLSTGAVGSGMLLGLSPEGLVSLKGHSSIRLTVPKDRGSLAGFEREKVLQALGSTYGEPVE